MNVSDLNQLRITTGEEQNDIDHGTSPNRRSSLRIPCLAESSITVGEKLGRGGFGSVYQGTLRGQTVAIKRIKIPELPPEGIQKLVHNELKLMVRLRHSNFVTQVLGYYQSDQGVSIVMTFAENGDLQQYLRKRALEGDWMTKAQICADVSKAVESVHDAGIVHGDLKAANILLDRFMTPKLADFGLSKTFTSIARGGQIGFTPRYIAPERLQNPGKEFTHQESVLSDIFSYGLIVWEIVKDGSLPYGEMDNLSIQIAKFSGKNQAEFVGKLPDDTPPVFESVILKYLAADPALRPSLASALEELHEYIDLGSPAFSAGSPAASTIAPSSGSTNSSVTPSNNSFEPSELRPNVTDDEINELTEAQKKNFVIGMYYFDKHKFAEAIEHFKAPELSDNSLAHRMLGHCHRAVGRDADSFKWFETSGGQGDSKAQFCLAWCFDNCYGTEENMEMAFQWYKKSAAQGNLEAVEKLLDQKFSQYLLRAIVKRTDERIDWLHSIVKSTSFKKLGDSAVAGNADSQCILAYLFDLRVLVVDKVDDKDGILQVDHSFGWFIRAGTGGNKFAQSEVVKRFNPVSASGLSVSHKIRNTPRTYEVTTNTYDFLLSAIGSPDTVGLAFARTQLGKCYQFGLGINKIQETLAFELYQLAARGGDVEGQCRLAMCYMYGIGTKNNFQKSFEYFSKAATAGFTEAEYQLGPVAWFEKSAEDGHPQAMRLIADHYERGDGIERNLQKARKWYKKALDNGMTSVKIKYLKVMDQIVQQEIAAANEEKPEDAPPLQDSRRPLIHVTSVPFPETESTVQRIGRGQSNNSVLVRKVLSFSSSLWRLASNASVVTNCAVVGLTC
ncbi:hypothetical protein BC937DRAFT_91131, partial [Endogone sp. FLAS-F59071]